MNPIQNKTPEERKAIAAKGHATRRERVAREQAIREEAKQHVLGLKDEIKALEAKLADLRKLEVMNAASCALTGKTLLPEEEIVKAALPWDGLSGVYFLIANDEVIYVGQSVNVYARLSQHACGKYFDHYAFIRCKPDILDKLESLYIHCLRPKLNGNIDTYVKNAPITLDKLLGLSNII
jgi:hypothetical protein